MLRLSLKTTSRELTHLCKNEYTYTFRHTQKKMKARSLL